MSIISCKNLVIGYGSKVVNKNISFNIESGDYICVLGLNGSGKSTLIKTILGLIPAIEGSILIDSDLKLNGIGYLPQQNDIQRSFPATVYEIVLSGCQKNKRLFYSKRERELALSKIKEMDIHNLKDESYLNLSGGQQQRVLLARALCVSDKLIVLDEPVNGLDFKTQESLYKIISELNKKGTTIIMISHDNKMARAYASHILHMSREKIWFGSSKEYKERVFYDE